MHRYGAFNMSVGGTMILYPGDYNVLYTDEALTTRAIRKDFENCVPNVMIRTEDGDFLVSSYHFRTNATDDASDVLTIVDDTLAVQTFIVNENGTPPVDVHTVTFDMQEHGEQIPSREVLEGTSIQAPTEPTETGWTFNAWYLDDDFEEPATFPYTVMSDVTFYAKWTVTATYTVSFDMNGIGEQVPPQTVYEGSRATQPETPEDPTNRWSMASYDWYTDNTTFLNMFSFYENITSNKTLYAGWTATVWLDDGEASSTENTRVGNVIQATQTPPTKEGYTFEGWYTSEEGSGEEWDPDTALTEEVATEYWGDDQIWLYAYFTPIMHTVAFDMNGHGTQIPSRSVQEGSTTSEPATPTASGWTFDGWYLDDVTFEEPVTFPYTVTEDVTFYAKWTQDSFTISFDMNGHGTQIPSRTAEYGDEIEEPEAPTATGYSFGGWYEDEELENPVSWPYIVTGSATLYAMWTINTYTVTFVMNGVGTQIAQQTVTHGGTATKPTNPIDYTSRWDFVDWYGDNTTFMIRFNFSTPVTQNTTLYACWKTGVDILANGTSVTKTVYVNIGNKVTGQTAQSKPGYSFDKWYTSRTGGVAWTFASYIIDAETILTYWPSSSPELVARFIWLEKTYGEPASEYLPDALLWAESSMMNQMNTYEIFAHTQDVLLASGLPETMTHMANVSPTPAFIDGSHVYFNYPSGLMDPTVMYQTYYNGIDDVEVDPDYLAVYMNDSTKVMYKNSAKTIRLTGQDIMDNWPRIVLMRTDGSYFMKEVHVSSGNYEVCFIGRASGNDYTTYVGTTDGTGTVPTGLLHLYCDFDSGSVLYKDSAKTIPASISEIRNNFKNVIIESDWGDGAGDETYCPVDWLPDDQHLSSKFVGVARYMYEEFPGYGYKYITTT